MNINNVGHISQAQVSTLARQIGLNLDGMPNSAQTKARQALTAVIEEFNNNPLSCKSPQDEFIKKTIESSRPYQY